MVIYLYVKTHSVTGMKYFGKTSKKDPYKYGGSGKHWLRHLKKHGPDVATEIIGIFSEESLCSEAALKFSKENNIANSQLWANLRDENGLDGAPIGHKGHKFTADQIQKLSESSKRRWADPEYKKRLSETHKTRLENEEERQKCGNAFRGKKRPEHSEKLKGRLWSEENKKKLRKAKHSGHGAKVSAASKGKPKSEAHRVALSEARKNVPIKTCPHCQVTMNACSYGRYHGDRCKLNPSI